MHPEASTGTEDPHGSVTFWIANLRDGEQSQAQQELWDRYFRRIVSLARAKLGEFPRGASDEEDVAISAMQSLFAGVARDRFPRLHDRNNLWSLLAKITARKAINEREKQFAQKRGGAKRKLSIGPEPDMSGAGLDPIDDDLGPDFVVALQEELQRLMEQLSDDTVRQVATRKLEGWSNAEIAEELGVVERTVERKLGLIRASWSPEEEAG